MSVFNMAMTLYDGQAHGVIDLPRDLHPIQEALMPYLVELLFSYVDEVFSYISVASSSNTGKEEQVDDAINKSSSAYSEIKEQFTRVGGVAVEFCVHIKRTDILFDEIYTKFIAVHQKDTFLELLEPYILKDMLGSLPPKIMQVLVEHYNCKGWLQRVEQCVLHMDISSLDFNQVVRLCRENGLYGALIYLFNKGLDDFKTSLEELLSVLKNHEKDTAVVGYRMLVYLKYCFSGVAFPPGHGTIPWKHLSSLRTEIVQYLLEDSGGSKPQISASFNSAGAYLNLCYLLELDTEASLDVLRIAFVENDNVESKKSFPYSPDVAIDNPEETEPIPGNSNIMIQKTVDALVLVLDVDISQTVASSINNDTDVGAWPSKKDIGHLIEFIASYVASKKAIVSKSVLNQILEYLLSENSPLPDDPEQMNESKKRREKKVLAMLDAVPQSEWNASYVLHLCEKAQFYLLLVICGLIHTIRCNYLTALDSYMKDINEPVHTFSFINDLLLKLSDSEATALRSAIISWIPELVILNRECTFFLVSSFFNRESGHVLSELRASPRSLFLYLKTLVEVHLSGTLNFSWLSVDDILDGPWGSKKNEIYRLETYLERISGFPKIIRDSPIEVTDEMVELYLQMLCQYEPDSVLKFLETFDHYRVDRCLQLCQEYGIVDAAAFLLERVGDVGSALLLVLSDRNNKFMMLDCAVGCMVSDMDKEKHADIDYTLAASGLKEVLDIKRILQSCIGHCQRNTSRLESEESESLWFHLLDMFCKPLFISQGNSEIGMFTDNPEVDAITWRIDGTLKYALVLKRLFSQFVKEIVEGMIGFVRLPSIMSKLLSDKGGQEFGDFKPTILGMLGTYGFEMKILFEMLNNLQMNQRGTQTDTMPQLKLAPPAVYHEKVNKRNQFSAGGSTEKQSKIKQLQDLKVKSSSNRFQLKSKIFGKEKIRVQ